MTVVAFVRFLTQPSPIAGPGSMRCSSAGRTIGATPSAVAHGLSGSQDSESSESRRPLRPFGAPSCCPTLPPGLRVPPLVGAPPGSNTPPAGLTRCTGRAPEPGCPSPMPGVPPIMPPGGIARTPAPSGATRPSGSPMSPRGAPSEPIGLLLTPPAVSPVIGSVGLIVPGIGHVPPPLEMGVGEIPVIGTGGAPGGCVPPKTRPGCLGPVGGAVEDPRPALAGWVVGGAEPLPAETPDELE